MVVLSHVAIFDQWPKIEDSMDWICFCCFDLSIKRLLYKILFYFLGSIDPALVKKLLGFKYEQNNYYKDLHL